MTAISTQRESPGRAVRWWLISVAILIAIMVLVGGATRLTESGLSIVEWKPLAGTLPPLNQEQWQQAFEALQDHSAISRNQCRHESRPVQDDFLVGMEPPAARARDRAAYLLPFLWFLWRGALARRSGRGYG